MKKLFALLLVLCMLVGLVACGKKPADPTGSNPTTPTGGGTVDSAEDPQFSMTPDKSPYNGKTLQIYGMGISEDYTDYDEFGKGTYLWMMKAAIEEWAAMNGAKIEYKGGYNQNQVMAAVQSGEKPDIIFQTGNFPAMANVGLTSPLTVEEVKTLADICGSSNYFDMMSYKGESHGFVFPWSGVQMLYYNKTMFENYGVKTPKEYFMEGAWNWTNFQKCLEEMTKDLDTDGNIDTYGIYIDSFAGGRLYNSLKEDDAGNLISRADDQITFDFYELMYNQVTVKKTVMNPGPNRIQTNVTYPMSAMQIGDCEPYNFEHLYQSLPNSDELEVVPAPVYDGSGDKEQTVMWTDSCGSLAATCDERAAALDLMAYLLKVGLKYISDYSLGAVKCDYPGMQGKCDLSKQWKEAFAKVCADRAKAVKNIDGYDEELVAKINEHINACTANMVRHYPKVSALTSYAERITLPPTSAIPVVKAKHQAELDVYNNTYIKK